MDKDELLNEIKSLEAVNAQERDAWLSMKAFIQDQKSKTEEIEKTFQAIRRQYEDATRELRNAQLDFEALDKRGRKRKEEVDILKRQLDRVNDSERIQEEYNQLVNEFREKCLSAPWRKENREDGIGAFDYQIEGAIELAVAKQALLGDKRGLGKTLTQLVWQDFVESKKTIAIVPNDTMENFLREVKFWAPHRAPIAIGGMPKAQRDFMLPALRGTPQFLIVLNYEAWRRDPILIQDLIKLNADTLVLDEAHRAKTMSTTTCRGILDLRFGLNECSECGNSDTDRLRHTTRDKQYAVCLECSHQGFITEFNSIKHVLPMTGTPIMNRPQELFPLAKLIDPIHFTTEKEYLQDYCFKDSNQHWRWRFGREKEVVKVLGRRYLARNRKDAGVIIPPQSEVNHIITQAEFEEGYPLQFKAYEQARKYGQIVLDPDNRIAMSMPVFITVLLRLRQVLVWPAALELKYKDPDTLEERVHARLNVEESVKLDKAEELITEIHEEGDRTVLFSMFKPGLQVLKNRLLKKGIRAAVYDGSTPKWEKSRIEMDFDPKHADPENYQYDVCLGNYKSMGEGLNMNAATQMILLDRYWNPAGEEQAAGRIDRIGTTRDTTVHRIMIESSVDTWMNSLIEEKKEIVGGFESQASVWRNAYNALLKGEL